MNFKTLYLAVTLSCLLITCTYKHTSAQENKNLKSGEIAISEMTTANQQSHSNKSKNRPNPIEVKNIIPEVVIESVKSNQNSIELKDTNNKTKNTNTTFLKKTSINLTSIIKITISLIALFLIFIIAFFTIKNVNSNEPTMNHFSIPESLEQKGYTGRFFAVKLIESITKLKDESKYKESSLYHSFAKNKKLKITYDSDIKIPSNYEIKLPGTGNNLHSIVSFLKHFINKNSSEINGTIVSRNNAYFLSIDINNKPSAFFKISLNDIDSSLLEPTKYIYKHLAPVILAFYFNTKEEYKKSNDIIKMRVLPDSDNRKIYHYAYNLFAINLDELGTAEDAIKLYNKAIEFKPTYATAYYNKAIALDDLGEFQESLANYDLAIRSDPKYYDAYFNKGNLLDDLGRHQEALKYYDIAIRLVPNEPDAYYNKGLALKELGKKKEAKEFLKISKELKTKQKKESEYI